VHLEDGEVSKGICPDAVAAVCCVDVRHKVQAWQFGIQGIEEDLWRARVVQVGMH